jgi:hypothetical protein
MGAYLPSIFLGVLGLYIVIMNFCIFVNNVILKRKWSSCAPFIGGICLAIAIALIPNNPYPWIGVLALLLDYSVILGIFLIVSTLVGKLKRKKESEDGK